uniref:Uncharacterized protein n=1 Tax=Callorhinchus milii TaxID=7868 RepID=A0A4W3H567_CALMI
MRYTLKEILKDCRVALKKMNNRRDKWVKEWPGQLVITSSQIQWTTDVTKALMTAKDLGDRKPLRNIKKKQVSDGRGQCVVLILCLTHAETRHRCSRVSKPDREFLASPRHTETPRERLSDWNALSLSLSLSLPGGMPPAYLIPESIRRRLARAKALGGGGSPECALGVSAKV